MRRGLIVIVLAALLGPTVITALCERLHYGPAPTVTLASSSLQNQSR